MRTAQSFVRVTALSLTFALAACGGSGGSGSPDGAAGAGAAGSDGGTAASDGGAGAGGSSGASGGGQSGAMAGAAGGGAGAAGGGAGAAAGGAGSGVATGGMDGGGAGTDGGADTAASEGGTADASDASNVAEGGAADGVEAGPGGLCAPIAIGAPAATVSNINNGKAVDTAAFAGGTIASGTYYLTAVTHFGAAYAGPTREIWTIDAAAKTLADAALTGSTASYVGYSVSNAATAVLAGVATCGASGTQSWNYMVIGDNLSVNPRGSSDVKIFTKQ
jgi:hypothetical protein